jgi:hypothetical protein
MRAEIGGCSHVRSHSMFSSMTKELAHSWISPMPDFHFCFTSTACVLSGITLIKQG